MARRRGLSGAEGAVPTPSPTGPPRTRAPRRGAEPHQRGQGCAPRRPHRGRPVPDLRHSPVRGTQATGGRAPPHRGEQHARRSARSRPIAARPPPRARGPDTHASARPWHRTAHMAARTGGAAACAARGAARGPPTNHGPVPLLVDPLPCSATDQHALANGGGGACRRTPKGAGPRALPYARAAGPAAAARHLPHGRKGEGPTALPPQRPAPRRVPRRRQPKAARAGAGRHHPPRAHGRPRGPTRARTASGSACP
jgi:hypothetical protein